MTINVNVDSGYQTNIRFAANQMSTAGGVTDANSQSRARFGKKHAVVDDERSVRRSARGAPSSSPRRSRSLSPDDPEAMPALGPQTYLPVNGVLRLDGEPHCRRIARRRR